MKKGLFRLYAVVISLLAVASVLLLIGDYNHLIQINSRPWDLVNYMIWLVFVLDYTIRFYLAENKKRFFLHNIFDLIAIIPFDILGSFRVVRAFRLIRLLRTFRLIGFTGRLIIIVKHFLKVTGLGWVFLISTALVLLSAVMYSLAEKISFMNALWWALVTTTTVGYGDIAPTTIIGRGVAVFLMFTGIGIVGVLTSAITNYFSKSNRSSNKNDDQIKVILKKLDRIEESNKKLNQKVDRLKKN